MPGMMQKDTKTAKLFIFVNISNHYSELRRITEKQKNI